MSTNPCEPNPLQDLELAIGLPDLNVPSDTPVIRLRWGPLDRVLACEQALQLGHMCLAVVEHASLQASLLAFLHYEMALTPPEAYAMLERFRAFHHQPDPATLDG